MGVIVNVGGKCDVEADDAWTMTFLSLEAAIADETPAPGARDPWNRGAGLAAICGRYRGEVVLPSTSVCAEYRYVGN